MKKFTIFFAVVVFFSLNSNVFAQWQTSGNNIYFNGGNVGIGTTDLSLGQSLLYFNRNNQTLRHIGLSENTDIFTISRTSTFDDFIIDANGNIGIGIGLINSSEKLEVKGKIKSSGSNSALILVSPNGTEWEITVDNSGNLITSQSTKVAEITDNNDISVYPNPTDNNIKIELNTNDVQKIKVELYDISGKMVYMKSYKSNSVNLDISDFETGTYILKIKNSEGQIIKTEKIVRK